MSIAVGNADVSEIGDVLCGVLGDAQISNTAVADADSSQAPKAKRKVYKADQLPQDVSRDAPLRA